MKRIGIYLRTSTQEQNTNMQRDELEDFVKARKWQIFGFYEDKITGTHLNRPSFKKLLRDARSRKVDVILVWKLDRAFRSLKDMVNVLQELTDLGVEFVSVKDQVDMTTTTGRLLAHLLGAFAEFESNLCRERVRSGIEAARKRGKVLGRPKTVRVENIIELRNAGRTYREISNILNVSPGSISLAIKKCQSTT